MDGNWKIIYASNARYQCEMLVQQLESANIHAVLLDKQDSSYHFGQVEVYVAQADMTAAQNLMQSLGIE